MPAGAAAGEAATGGGLYPLGVGIALEVMDLVSDILTLVSSFATCGCCPVAHPAPAFWVGLAAQVAGDVVLEPCGTSLRRWSGGMHFVLAGRGA